MTPRPSIRDNFPYPIARPYSLTFDLELSSAARRWALCFTQYQTLRMVVLSLISQYLREPIDEAAKEAVRIVNERVASLRSPMFSDWITAIRTLPRHWDTLKLQPLFPDLTGRLKALSVVEERTVAKSGQRKLDPLEAILALRNATAHGGIPNEAEAERHLEEYIPVLHRVLDAFDFLGGCELKVCEDRERVMQELPTSVRTLRGDVVHESLEETLPPELEAAFVDSPTVLVTPSGKAVPLDPLLNRLPHAEPLYLYDGHYGIRVGAQSAVESRYIYYLGIHDRQTETNESRSAAERLRELLTNRQISYDLPKGKVAPWTLAESARDYSRRTLEDLRGSKYFPECYVPFPVIEQHIDAFLGMPARQHWTKNITRPRYRNGLVLTGLAGSGKTALLARRVEQWLTAGDPVPGAPLNPDADRENPTLVLFLRGDGIALRPEGISLYRDVAEKLGISVGGKGMGTFAELFDHLHPKFLDDRIVGRRLILVLDALNEAPLAEQVTREALELVGLAARFPWCKVIVSSRMEWLNLMPERLGAGEVDPLQMAREYLYDPDPERADGQRRLPALTLQPLTSEQGAEVYENFQQRTRSTTPDGYRYSIPACLTPWSELQPDLRRVLLNPLYLYLFMKAFAGQPAGRVDSVPELYRLYVENATERNIGPSISAVVEHLLRNVARPGADLIDDDANAIRRAWSESLSVEEARVYLGPVEALVHEGILRKRIGEEGGGYRFVYQTVAEYLVYRVLRDRRADSADELAHWRQLANHPRVFTEYAGAFQFLLRNWDLRDDGRLWIGDLVSTSPDWVANVLSVVMEHFARVDFVPGQASPRVERLAAILKGHPIEIIGRLLNQTGLRLLDTQFAPSAIPCIGVCVAIREEMWTTNPDNLDNAKRLAASLNHLGVLFRSGGRMADAEVAYRRSLSILEEALKKDERSVEISDALASSLNNFGVLLRAGGRMKDAEVAYRRSVQMYEELHRENRTNRDLARGFARSLNSLGNLLSDVKREAEAEAIYRQSLDIFDELYVASRGDIEAAAGVGSSLNNLGILLRGGERKSEAEDAYRRGVQVYEELYANNVGSLEVAYGLTTSLTGLGMLLRAVGRVAEANDAHRRSLEIREALFIANQGNIDIKAGFARSLCTVERWDEAEKLVDEIIAFLPQHSYARQLKKYIRSQRNTIRKRALGVFLILLAVLIVLLLQINY